MPLHPDARRYLESARNLAPVSELGPARARERRRQQVRDTPDVTVPVARVVDGDIDGPSGPVGVRLYHPTAPAPRPVLVYLHGGGWVMGDLDQVDVACRLLCRATGAVVVSVDYHLAPEHPFPIPVEEAHRVLGWAVERAEDLGGDPRRLTVAGDSSGGNLALAAAMMARDRGGPVLAAMVLVYPVCEARFDTPSYEVYARGYGLTRDDMVWFWKQYAPSVATAHPYAAPLRASDLSGLPPAVLVAAEYDVLRSEGQELERRLAEAGVPIVSREFPGLLHGFFTAPWAKTHREQAVTWVAAQLGALWASETNS